MNPIRIQRKRVKGWKMPANTVYVGRPTKWGNHWTIIPGLRDVKTCCERYEHEIIMNPSWRETIKKELKGKNLACWCPLDQPCHADILIKYANEKIQDHELKNIPEAHCRPVRWKHEI